MYVAYVCMYPNPNSPLPWASLYAPGKTSVCLATPCTADVIYRIRIVGRLHVPETLNGNDLA